MSRRRSMCEADSLELLLDTICDVFGTIMLMSLIIALSLDDSTRSASRAAASRASQADLITTETERDELTARLTALRKGESQQADLGSVIASAELVRHANRLREAEAARANAIEAKSEATGAASKAQVKINDIDQIAEERAEEIKRAETELEKLEKQLADSVEERSRAATIPKMAHTSLTTQATFFLKAGRLYGPLELPGGGFDERDFEIVEKGDTLVIMERTSSGINVDKEARSLQRVREKFNGVEPSSAYVTLWIWDDSYEYFNAIRIVLEERGIKYQLKPSESETSVFLTAEPQEPAVVQ